MGEGCTSWGRWLRLLVDEDVTEIAEDNECKPRAEEDVGILYLVREVSEELKKSPDEHHDDTDILLHNVSMYYGYVYVLYMQSTQ